MYQDFLQKVDKRSAGTGDCPLSRQSIVHYGVSGSTHTVHVTTENTCACSTLTAT